MFDNEGFRYFIHMAYDGSKYHGWQIQPNDISVQKVMDHAISLLLRDKLETFGCGRTDSGVHARNFYAHFDHSILFNQEELNALTFKLNSFLPHDIVVFEIYRVQPDAHARFSAINRTYKYYISRKKDPFTLPYSWYYHPPLNIDLMKRGAEMLKSYSDFAAFSKKDTDIVGTLCKLEFARWEEVDNQLIFTIKANRFLRNMVRAITGTLMEMGRGKLDEEGLHNVIESRDRCKAGESVPAAGLFLHEVGYPGGIRIVENL
jgi:tRNA pseudouridine38-40 synthase